VGTASKGTIPVVQAPEGPVKEKPAKPGGMKVPYQDKQILNQSGDDGAAGDSGKVERLLPPPEQPKPPKPAPETTAEGQPTGQGAKVNVTPPPTMSVDEKALEQSRKETEAEVAAGGSASNQGQGVDTGNASDATPKTVEKTPEPKKAPETAPATKTGTEQAEPPKATAPKPKPKPAKAETAAPKPAASGKGYFLQLASLRSEDGAKREWSQIKKKHGGLLGALSMKVERADLGSRGIFYRLLTGPLPNEATAKDLCRQLKDAGQACLVKRP
jgi:cell division septation protein DedD